MLLLYARLSMALRSQLHWFWLRRIQSRDHVIRMAHPLAIGRGRTAPVCRWAESSYISGTNHKHCI